MMEVKVWVDGIQRVVCGATFDTTCQDVVIALAHAMGRTGRFTLIEKWRDNDRPLTPAECPLRVLHKWGEYAAEVRFILCQADSEHHKHTSRERLAKKGVVDRPTPQPSKSAPQQMNGVVNESSVKRSLTFSGAHNQAADDSAWLSASAPNSKFRKTHLGPVPNGEIMKAVVNRLGKVGGGQQGTSLQHSVSRPHHFVSGEGVSEKASVSPPTPSSLQLSNSMRRVSAFQPLQPSRCRTAPPSAVDSSSHPQTSQHPRPQTSFRPPQSSSQPHTVSQPMQTSRLGTVQVQHQQDDTHIYANSSVAVPPPLPSSPPPPSLSLHRGEISQRQKVDGVDPQTVVTSDPSGQTNFEIEEYDLDHGFSDRPRDSSRDEQSAVSLEYRLEEGLESGSGLGSRSGGHLEGEHAKLMRLVNMQQQRLKTQESQISLVNTEISALEEKENEYEENLHIIMEELLLQENRQRDLEPQISELEKVEWENVLSGEKKCEEDLKQKIASCKAMVAEQDHKINHMKNKESELLHELRVEEGNIQQERERLKRVEEEAKQEEHQTKEKILTLQAEFSDLQKKSEDSENSLADVSCELKSVEKNLEEKKEELSDLESDMKMENLKELQERRPVEGGESLTKVMENRLAPHPAVSTDNPSSPPFMTLATANQSGVWV